MNAVMLIPTAILIKLADFHQTSTDYSLNRTTKKNLTLNVKLE